MIITEADLRALWQNGRQPLPPFPPGTRFSPSAQDFLKDHSLNVRFAAPMPAPPAEARAALPAPLPARLDALNALAALTAAQARHFRLPTLADRLDLLAEEAAPLPVGPAAPPALRPAPTPNPPPFAPDHIIVQRLRLLHAEAAAVARLARDSAAPPQLLHRLEAMCVTLLDLECRFLSGELAWPVGP